MIGLTSYGGQPGLDTVLYGSEVKVQSRPKGTAGAGHMDVEIMKSLVVFAIPYATPLNQKVGRLFFSFGNFSDVETDFLKNDSNLSFDRVGGRESITSASDLRFRLRQGLGGCQFGFHAVEGFNVGDFTIHGFRPSKAHDHQHKSIFCQGKCRIFSKPARGWNFYKNLCGRKIALTEISRTTNHDVANKFQHIFVLFAKISGNVSGNSAGLFVDQGNDRLTVVGHKASCWFSTLGVGFSIIEKRRGVEPQQARLATLGFRPGHIATPGTKTELTQISRVSWEKGHKNSHAVGLAYPPVGGSTLRYGYVNPALSHLSSGNVKDGSL